MRKTLLTFLFGIIAGCAQAQSGLVGFANYADLGLNGTTGGAGGRIVHVTTRADFEKYAGATEPYIIILDADLKGFYDYSSNPKQKHDVVSVKSNKTIIGGGGGARLDSLGLDINGQQNIIIRNLRISKADPDAIAFRNTHHVWVDHCDLSSQKASNDANDGLLDFTYGSSYLTVSWCKFHDHDKTSICSSGSRNIADYGRQRVTYHHNSFVNCTQRNPRIGYGLGHIFNDCNDTNTSYAIGGFSRAIINVENCYFKNVKEAFNQMYAKSKDDAYWGFFYSSGNIFNSTSDGKTGNSDGFDVGRYYDHRFAMDETAAVPALMSRAGCVSGIESDLIPYPGNGATQVKKGTKIFCSDIEGATGYIYKIGTSAATMAVCDPAAVDLQPGTTYFWQAEVVGGSHDGTVSDVFRFTTAAEKATCPTPEDGEEHTPLREIVADKTPCAPLTLRWRAGFDDAGYTVYVGRTEDLSDAVAVQTAACAYRPGNLRHGERYYWRVDTRTADGATVSGDVWNFRSDISRAKAGRNEAEHAVRGGLCFPELDNSSAWILASNDSCVVGDQGPGCFSFVWGGETAVYDVTTTYFDEASGKGTYSVYVNEERIDTWTASANNNKLLKRTSRDITLKTGDELRIDFCTDGNMRCRTDCLDIVKVGEVSGINSVRTSPDAPKRVYSTDGRYLGTSIDGLNSGMYIVVSSGKATKIIKNN